MTQSGGQPALTLEDRRRVVAAAERVRAARIRLARLSSAAFCEYVLRDEETHRPIELTEMHREWHELADQNPRLIVWSHLEAGKGLPLDTPIPTPHGWTTMGELKTGEVVFAGAGEPVRVTAVSPVTVGLKCFRFTFDDGSELVADEAHRWKAQRVERVIRRRETTRVAPSRAHEGDGKPCVCGCGRRAKPGKVYIKNHHTRVSVPEWEVYDTRTIFEAGVIAKTSAASDPQYRWRMPLQGTAQYPEVPSLPVDPYWLGAWLGDGDSHDPVITMHESDCEILARMEEAEGQARRTTDRRSPHVLRARFIGDRPNGKLRTRLRHLGLLQNKHIPTRYMVAGEPQRRALLAGLLDTDGTVTQRGHVQFSNTNLRLIGDVLGLVRSLGYKAHLTEKIAKIYGRAIGPAYTVSFVAPDHVFWLRRKREKQTVTGERFGRSGYRSVVAIEEVKSVPTRCIAVDSIDHTYLAGTDYVVTHNTQQLSIGRALFRLGQDPSRRIVILSNTHATATKIATTIQRYIENSPELREVWPHLRKATPWSSNAFNVVRSTYSKDYSVQVVGSHGHVQGNRIDDLMGDDILDHNNTLTEEARKRLNEWFFGNFPGRITERGSGLIVGNAHHPHDLLHVLRDRGYAYRTYPVERPDGTIRFPKKWSPARIAAKRIELGPLEAARQLDCVARDEGSIACRPEWVQQCLRRGLGVSVVASMTPEQTPPGAVVYVGVDLGVKKKATSGKTVIFALLAFENGDRQVLAIKAGRFGAREIIQAIQDFHQRFGAVVYCEDNGAQDFLIQIAGEDFPDAHLWLVPFSTGANKMHPVYGLQSVFADFSRSQWIIPAVEAPAPPRPEDDTSPAPPVKLVGATREIAEWLAECEVFDPKTHTGDALMGSWFAREAARLGPVGVGGGGGSVSVLGGTTPPPARTPEDEEELAQWAILKKRR